jgi:predicted translin family RNA/ssDNA-binding protein
MATEFNVSEALSQRLGDYQRWREELIVTIQSYQAWVEQEGLAEGETDLRVYEVIEALKADKLTIAIVGEFSRGKTELINAIFFADQKQRLLPTEAGRTTMCPTELRYDEDVPPCIRLLPIETRQGAQTIGELKLSPSYWTVFPLDLNSPAKIAQSLGEIVKSKTVSIPEAQALGLYNPSAPESGAKVQVPLWRHAIVNYPHQLLKEGLVILDTPGLNSLGTEPELTMSMLPTAHVVLFVLAADTGVTKSDMHVWEQHVCVAKTGAEDGRLVVLNKIDTLWDELRGPAAVAASISRQAQETAASLKISKNRVFPISAQKGLVGKIKGDAELTQRSGLPTLERELSDDIIPRKQALIRDKVVSQIGGIVKNTAAMVETRLSVTNAELKELRGISGKNQSVIESLLAKKGQDQQAYDKKLASLENTKHVLGDQVKLLLNYLSMEALDDLIAKTRTDMKGSWTTHGLKHGMKTFFDGAMLAMDKVHKQTERMKGLLETIYKQFQVEHGLAKIKLDSFALEPYWAELQRLYREAEVFRNSPAMVATEQHFVVKRFFITLVSRARHVFDECNAAAEAWSKAVMAPVFAQIREHKLMMDQRMENLRKIHNSMKHLHERIAQLEAAKGELEKQQQVNRAVLEKINQTLSPITDASLTTDASEEAASEETSEGEVASVRGAA